MDCDIATRALTKRDENAFRTTARRSTYLALLRRVEPQQDSNREILHFIGCAIGAALDANGDLLVEQVRGVLHERRLPRRGVTLDDVGRRGLVRHRAARQCVGGPPDENKGECGV